MQDANYKMMKTNKQLIGIDLFAGAGGLSLGAEMAGISMRYAVEADAYAAASYKRNFKNATVFCEDIRKLSADKLNTQPVFIIMGGPPCQGFSLSNTKTSKDFSIDSIWYEVKTVSAGKDAVRISSIEQLDSNVDGCLAVYKLEKMSPGYNGVKLSSLANEIMTLISSDFYKEMFARKLMSYGFDWSSDYDNFVYSQSSFAKYIVSEGFPRIMRNSIALPIIKVQYELILSNLEEFKQS